MKTEDNLDSNWVHTKPTGTCFPSPGIARKYPNSRLHVEEAFKEFPARTLAIVETTAPNVLVVNTFFST